MGAVDEYVGRRINQRRRHLRLTQAELGARIGLKHQTIHKFECGAIRICSEHLWRLSGALQVPVSYFFDGLEAIEPLVPAAHSGEQI